ncbi:MAG: hypothetical protein ABR498_10140 [Candidatus Dormibacteria bacterium]
MTKRTVTKTWLWGLGFFLAGIVALATGIGVMLGAAGTWSQTDAHSWSYSPNLDALFYSMVALICIGGVAILAGGIAQFVAWVGAMINTARSHDKTWFILLLVLGLLGFQFVMMIVYLIAGPDVPKPLPYAWTAPPPLPPPATAHST